MTHARHAERDNNFNLLRLLLATTVLLGHAYEMAYNDRSMSRSLFSPAPKLRWAISPWTAFSSSVAS